MKRLCRRITESLSNLLEQDERAVVLGDIEESGEPAAQALRDVLGLVLRRQASLWKGARQWWTLFALVIPLGVVLGTASMRTAHTGAIYFWLYANNWDWELARSSAFQHNLLQFGTKFALSFLQLFLLSWASGLLLASIGRRATPANTALFCLAVLATPFPQPLSRPVVAAVNAPVFALPFYHAVFPWIVQAALVLLPSLWGMGQGARKEKRV
jgi:hypothetical protein